MDGWYFLVRLGILEISSEPRGGILIRCHDVGADLKKSRESKSVRLVRSQVRPEFQLQTKYSCRACHLHNRTAL